MVFVYVHIKFIIITCLTCLTNLLPGLAALPITPFYLRMTEEITTRQY